MTCRLVAAFYTFFLACPFVVGAETRESDEVLVATQGPSSTSVAEVLAYLRDRVPESRRPALAQDSDAVFKLTESLLTMRRLALEGQSSGLIDTEEIERRVLFARERITAQAYLQAFAEKKTANAEWEAVARELYLASPETYSQPEQVSAAHVLISTQERSPEEALAMTQELLQRLRDGEDFESIAKEYSEDPSVDRNKGYLGVFGRGQMEKPFEEAAFAMRDPGELVGPVETRYGFHIIKLVDYFPEVIPPFEDVKAQLERRAKQSMISDIKQAKLVEVRSEPAVEYTEKGVDALREHLSMMRVDSEAGGENASLDAQ